MYISIYQLKSIGDKTKYEALLALPLNRNHLTTSWSGAFYIFRGVVSWKHVSEIHVIKQSHVFMLALRPTILEQSSHLLLYMMPKYKMVKLRLVLFKNDQAGKPEAGLLVYVAIIFILILIDFCPI